MRTSLSRISLVLAIAAFVLAVPVQAQYTVTNLVSDGSVAAAFTDPALVNPWGMVHSPNGPWWVANNATSLGTVYTGDGTKLPPEIEIIDELLGVPTGVIYNQTFGFLVTKGTRVGVSQYIYATETGQIAGFSSAVDREKAILAPIELDDDDPDDLHAVYKGLAYSKVTGWLYAADFYNGVVRVFDRNWFEVKELIDPHLPDGYAPFGIRVLNNTLYVTLAKQGPGGHDDVPGPGNGFVDTFTLRGKFIQRLISDDVLNSPWGLAAAPSDFGPFSNKLLVGNFGDGMINAFEWDGTFLGALQDGGAPIVIDGLWSIDFGNGGTAGPKNWLYFTAGVNDEAGGLFGVITP
jgi:uncharacterized protein (TIGR03118 family)